MSTRLIRNSISLFVVMAALVVAAMVGVYTGTAAAHPPSVPDLKLAATTGQSAIIDVGQPGMPLGLGDQIVSNDVISRAGKKVGSDGVVCTIVKTTEKTMTCHWTMNIVLPEGQLTLQGIADGPASRPTEPLTFTLAVTGGTGRYAAARGQAVILDNPDETEIIAVHFVH